jgi:DNA-binding beta-propeller fold protein YncE
VIAAFALLASMLAPAAQASACPAPTKGIAVAVPGHPFGVVATDDNCWAFATLDSGKKQGAIAVLHNEGGQFTLARSVEVKSNLFGAALTHDGKLLAVAAADNTAIFDVGRLEQGDGGALLGMLDDGARAGAIYAAIGKDDRVLFVSDEYAKQISVFDLAKIRSGRYGDDARIGRVHTAAEPVGLAVSTDGRWLFATNEIGPASSRHATDCEPETSGQRKHGPGLLVRIDVEKAATDPEHALADAMPAGCNPVRVAVAPSGSEVWVTARGGNELLQFHVAEWLAGSGSARTQGYAIGPNPIGVAVRPDGRQVWAALSNRFGKDRDAKGELAGVTLGADGSVGASMSAPAKGFPRELTFLHDGRTLVATLFDAQQVEFVPTPN